jgi:hypothetical protein
MPAPPTAAERPGRLGSAAPWLALLAASVLYRLPPLVNAAGTNSDAAIVGLQAMHVLRGERSWFLYGSGYQTSVDSHVAALFFLPFGPSPLALMLSTFCGHLLLTWLAYATLRRHLPAWTAALATTPLVFTPGPLHTYILYAPRQASLTLAFASVWVLDGAGGSRRPLGRLALGMGIAAVACFADPYAMIFVPSIALFALLVGLDALPDARAALRRVGALAGGGALGAVPYWLLTHSAGATRGQTALSVDVLPHNWKLFTEECLPWLLSLKVYYSKAGMDYGPWVAPKGFAAVQILGALALVLGLLYGGAALRSRRLSWAVRRLGLAGFAMVPVAVGGFLTSLMVMDFFSTRYLASILLFAPFALAPAAASLRRSTFALALAPYLVSAAVAGWVHYGTDVDGPSIRTEAGRAEDERALAALLRGRGIRYAMADYWASYRLTFLFGEDPVVVPKNPGEDRYPAYRQAWEAAPFFAYVFDPLRSREDFAEEERVLCEGAESCERTTAGHFTVVFVKRARGEKAALGDRGGESVVVGL